MCYAGDVSVRSDQMCCNCVGDVSVRSDQRCCIGDALSWIVMFTYVEVLTQTVSKLDSSKSNRWCVT